jgi:hypothetical protein
MRFNSNKNLIEKKHRILRQIDNKIIPYTPEVKEELLQINNTIFVNVKKSLESQVDQIQEKTKEFRKKIFSDGQLKREIAIYLSSLLEDNFTKEEIKGIFRAGYKFTRGF